MDGGRRRGRLRKRIFHVLERETRGWGEAGTGEGRSFAPPRKNRKLKASEDKHFPTREREPRIGNQGEIMGRKKVEIKRIENKDARHVTFSKRRAGLFKKLAEICLLSGGEAAALVCSPGGKLHLFAHPHESLVFNRFTAGENNILVPSELGRERKNESEFRTEFAELQAVLEAERDRRRWWEETDLDGLHVEKLTGIRSSLADLRMGVVARMAHLEREREE